MADPPDSVVEPVIALMTKTPEVEPEPPDSPPDSPPDESTSLWLEPAFEFFKSFCSLQEEIAAMKNKIRILKDHLMFNLLRISILN